MEDIDRDDVCRTAGFGFGVMRCYEPDAVLPGLPDGEGVRGLLYRPEQDLPEGARVCLQRNVGSDSDARATPGGRCWIGGL